MSEITLNDLEDENWLIYLKKYNSNSQNVIFDYRREGTDGAGSQYLVAEVVEPYLESVSADSSVIYFMDNLPLQGLRIFSARNENFPLEPYPDLYGYNFVYNSEDLDTDIHAVFENLVFSGIDEFVPPLTQKTLIYDFKFIKNKGNYTFSSFEAGGSGGSVGSGGSGGSRGFSGGGY